MTRLERPARRKAAAAEPTLGLEYRDYGFTTEPSTGVTSR